jgi:hypothetical protein
MGVPREALAAKACSQRVKRGRLVVYREIRLSRRTVCVVELEKQHRAHRTPVPLVDAPWHASLSMTTDGKQAVPKLAAPKLSPVARPAEALCLQRL